jgi:hypothetical protein
MLRPEAREAWWDQNRLLVVVTQPPIPFLGMEWILPKPGYPWRDMIGWIENVLLPTPGRARRSERTPPDKPGPGRSRDDKGSKRGEDGGSKRRRD